MDVLHFCTQINSGASWSFLTIHNNNSHIYWCIFTVWQIKMTICASYNMICKNNSVYIPFFFLLRVLLVKTLWRLCDKHIVNKNSALTSQNNICRHVRTFPRQTAVSDVMKTALVNKRTDQMGDCFTKKWT